MLGRLPGWSAPFLSALVCGFLLMASSGPGKYLIAFFFGALFGLFPGLFVWYIIDRRTKP
jgi:hypothetical protein